MLLWQYGKSLQCSLLDACISKAACFAGKLPWCPKSLTRSYLLDNPTRNGVFATPFLLFWRAMILHGWRCNTFCFRWNVDDLTWVIQLRNAFLQIHFSTEQNRTPTTALLFAHATVFMLIEFPIKISVHNWTSTLSLIGFDAQVSCAWCVLQKHFLSPIWYAQWIHGGKENNWCVISLDLQDPNQDLNNMRKANVNENKQEHENEPVSTKSQQEHVVLKTRGYRCQELWKHLAAAQTSSKVISAKNFLATVSMRLRWPHARLVTVINPWWSHPQPFKGCPIRDAPVIWVKPKFQESSIESPLTQDQTVTAGSDISSVKAVQDPSHSMKHSYILSIVWSIISVTNPRLSPSAEGLLCQVSTQRLSARHG